MEENKNKCWLEIPELGPDRKFFLPLILTPLKRVEQGTVVEISTSPDGQTERLTFKEYLKYIGLRWDRWKIIGRDKFGSEDKFTPEMMADSLPELLPELWKTRLKERAKIAEKIKKDIEAKEKQSGIDSKGQETFKEATEKAFAKLLEETGYFDEATAAEWTNDVLDAVDVIVKLEDGGYLAIQHSVLADSVRLKEKRAEIMKQGKITLPEHLEYGRMPLVFVKDDARNYLEEAEADDQTKQRIPLIEYYKRKLMTNPDAKLWKFFKGNINQMIANWLDQIIYSLAEELGRHSEADRNFYFAYLDKIKKIAQEHQATRPDKNI